MRGGGDSTATTTTTTTTPSSTLSGTAAGGAAVVGTVEIKDSLGATRSVVIESNGHYSVDTNGMTGPFMLKAAGTVGNTHVEYYSAATSADVGGWINITPLTNLLVSNIAAQLASTYYNNPANFSGITAASLAAAETALQAKLQPILTAMGLDASIDLLRASFATDHSGLDAVLDLVKIEPATGSPNMLNIINTLTGITIASDDVTSHSDDSTVTTISTTDMTAMASAKTDLQLIVDLLNSLSAKFATGIPTETNLATLFDTSLTLNSGRNFPQMYSGLTDSKMVGITFSNVAITPVANNPNRMMFDAIVVFDGYHLRWYADKSATGSWKLIGDQQIVEADIQARAELRTSMTTSQSTIQNGLSLSLDPSDYNATHNGIIDHAVVTGPGLPTLGVSMNKGTNSWMTVAGTMGNYLSDCALPSAIQTACVSVSDTVDNGKYTVKLYDASNNALNGAGYEMYIAKKPVATSTLTASMFPNITSVTVNGVALTTNLLPANANITVTWTLPAGLNSDNLDIYAGGSGFSLNVGVNLLATDLSKTLAMGNTAAVTATYAGAWLSAQDAYGRDFAHSLSTGY